MVVSHDLVKELISVWRTTSRRRGKNERYTNEKEVIVISYSTVYYIMHVVSVVLLFCVCGFYMMHSMCAVSIYGVQLHVAEEETYYYLIVSLQISKFSGSPSSSSNRFSPNEIIFISERTSEPRLMRSRRWAYRRAKECTITTYRENKEKKKSKQEQR
jgi:hypothetical protein